MLKIKDNVDLKQLEKFGFKINYDDWYEYRLNDYSNIYVKPISRELLLRAYSISYFADNDLTKLYDLIKADLVEKRVSNE